MTEYLSDVERSGEWACRSWRWYHRSDHYLSPPNGTKSHSPTSLSFCTVVVLAVIPFLFLWNSVLSSSEGRDSVCLQVNTRQQTERVAKKGLRNSDGSLPTSKRHEVARPTNTLLQIIQVSFLFSFLFFFHSFFRTNGRNFSQFFIWLDGYQVIRTEGWGGLYSGLRPSLFGTAASQVGSLFFPLLTHFYFYFYLSITVFYLCFKSFYSFISKYHRKECINDKIPY